MFVSYVSTVQTDSWAAQHEGMVYVKIKISFHVKNMVSGEGGKKNNSAIAMVVFHEDLISDTCSEILF